ncbi:SdiA-regulated domain-containing protein, partial [Pseudomonas aeruginosa]
TKLGAIHASLEGGVSLHVRDMSNLVKDKVFATDLSSVVFDQQSGHLILLSDESKLLIEMTDEGKVVSFRSLARGFAGLLKGIPQAEGVTIDDEGYLYVVSEPNLFYRFTRETD